MKTTLRFLIVILGFSISTLPAPIFADGGGDSGSSSMSADPDMEAAQRAIKGKNWAGAIESLNKLTARDSKNANAWNLLGYSERQRGNLDVAFKHYERALALDPNHRGAHEYVGEAYLKVGNLAKAEEHLARLDKLCLFPCEEYSDLKEAIAEYKKKK